VDKKLTLYGFNNLTKTLSFNIYDICYASSERERLDYIAYIDEQYNTERLTGILLGVTERIGATVLNISKQDYEPQGASVNILIAEQHVASESIDASCNQGNFPGAADIHPCHPDTAGSVPIASPMRDTIHAHLDKSHLTVHTFPEQHPENAISTFRVDIDVATCGTVSPVNTLDYLISSFDSDIITIDYRVRGFTRDITGQKHFHDHQITSIQDFIDSRTLKRYDAVDINVYQANLYHTRMLLKEIDLQNYLFNQDVYELPPRQRLEITSSLRREMIEIFSGTNIY